MFVKELLEVLYRYADVNIVVDLYGNARTVAFAYAKAAGKHHIVFDMIFFNSLFEQCHYFVRAFEMTGRPHTNLNE